MPKRFEDSKEKKKGWEMGVHPNWKQNGTPDQLGRTFFKLASQERMQQVPLIWTLLYGYLEKSYNSLE